MSAPGWRRVLSGPALLALALLVLSACVGRRDPPLRAVLARLPDDVSFAAVLDPIRLVGPGGLGAAWPKLEGLFDSPDLAALAGLVGEASTFVVFRRDPVPDAAGCDAAVAHAARLLQAAAGGHEPRRDDVEGMRRACLALGLSTCLSAARDPGEALRCAASRQARAGARWGVLLTGLADAEASATTIAGHLGLRVHPGVPRFADGARAVQALGPGEVVVGEPDLVRAVHGVAAGRQASLVDQALFRPLVEALPRDAAAWLLYRGLGDPPSLEAAGLAVQVGASVDATWRLHGADALSSELPPRLAALREHVAANRGAWADLLRGGARFEAGEARDLLAAVSTLVEGASATPCEGGVRVTSSAPLALARLLTAWAARP
jgi:hypothetical protein